MRRIVVPADVDARGFAWPLAPLAARLELLVRRALEDLAHRERERLQRQAELDALEREQAQQLETLAPNGRAIDPAQRHHVLSYLASGLDRVHAQQEVLAAAATRVQEARQAQLAAQRRSDIMGRLQEAALANHVAQERRRAANEADSAWLAAHSASQARSGHEGAA